MGDIIGRRWGLIASNGVFVLGVILQTIATSIPPFLAGRFFAGLGVGLISALGEPLPLTYPRNRYTTKQLKY
jgi:MFS family permease